MKKTMKNFGIRQGFSLAEVVAALTIGAMVLVALLTIYNRAESSAEAIEQRLENSGIHNEVLQRIAEDLDKIIAGDQNTKISFENKIINGYPAATLTITRYYKDAGNQNSILERITWVSSYDYQNLKGGLILYRSYEGKAMEDMILDKAKTKEERERYVPVCSGITYLKITAPKDQQNIEKWENTPPAGITVTISFDAPARKTDGTLDVPEDKKFTRTIAIDRTRKINFYIEQARPDSIGQTSDKRSSPSGKTGAK
jgi:prepilin-type N-terminal cleavage/methylation domain-containing protein